MRLFAPVFVAVMMGLAPITLADEPRSHSVLVLDELTQIYDRSIEMNRAFIATLNQESAGTVYTYIENLGLNTFGMPHYYELLRDYLKEKYKNTNISVIVSYGSLSLPFARKLRDELWPSKPLVFAGVNEVTFATLKRANNETGTTIRHRLADMVAIAKAIIPNFRSITLVGDPLGTENYWRHFLVELPKVENETPVIDLTGMPIDELKKRVSTLPEGTVIAYVGLSLEKGRIRYTHKDGLQLIAKWANRPIIVDIESFIGFGAVGGRVVNAAAIGREAARRTWHIMNGETPSLMPVTSLGTLHPVFDWRQLQRWSIDGGRLPKGSEIVFRSPTAWEQYHWQIVAIVMTLLAQSWLIVWFVRERRRRRYAEMEVRLRLAELGRLNRSAAAGVLTASIAHEVNQPLAAIVSSGNTALRWLSKQTPNIEEVSIALKRIVREGHRAGEVISAVRSMLRMDAPEHTQVHVGKLIREVVGLLRHQLTRHRITVEYRIADDLSPVSANRIQLQQVILNLIINAVEAMRSVSDRIRILQIAAEADAEGNVSIIVADNGTGIDPKHMDRLCETFFTTKPDGMGMGLSICRSIIENHDGRLTAAPRVPHGAAFTVVIPSVKSSAH